MTPQLITLIIGVLAIGFWSYIWLSRLERIIKRDVEITVRKALSQHS